VVLLVGGCCGCVAVLVLGRVITGGTDRATDCCCSFPEQLLNRQRSLIPNVGFVSFNQFKCSEKNLSPVSATSFSTFVKGSCWQPAFCAS